MYVNLNNINYMIIIYMYQNNFLSKYVTFHAKFLISEEIKSIKNELFPKEFINQNLMRNI